VLSTPVAAAQHLLVWDSETIDETCNFHYGGPDSTEAYAGQWCFAGLPDPWHAPGIVLCADTWREDISGHDELWFYTKSDSLNRTFDFYISGWPYDSRRINIDPYIAGAQLDTTYNLVRLPIDSLKTAEYQLQSIETLYFGTAQPEDGHRIFVDDVWAMDVRPTQIDSVCLLANNVIGITVADRFDLDYARTLGNYQIASDDDVDFGTGVSPTEVGIHYYVDDFAKNAPAPHIVFEIFLIYAPVLKNGHSYHLTVENIRDAAGNDFVEPFGYDFTFADQQYINGSVKVNQVGYLPEGLKYGYIGNYLGDAGMMDIAPTTFEIRDAATGNPVFTGTPTFRGEDAVLSGERVYDCDMSSLSTPGTYFLYVPGVGRSPTFAVAADVFDEPYFTSAHALYYQRCGMALAPPQADPRWVHGECHADDGYIHESHLESELYDDETIGERVPMPRGWHDAGDYGKYVPTAAVALHTLFTAFELYPQRFPDGLWNIPESGNGMPDVLDEIKWELDWLRRMQSGDGGVFHKITTTAYADSMPEQDTDTRWISPKSTHATAIFAAVMAAAYRNFLPYQPDFADSCLGQAELAWQFLQNYEEAYPPDGFTNPPGIGGGEYNDPLGDRDDRAWAAAELYKTTGLAQYHDAFEQFWAEHTPDWGWNEFQHHQKKASWAYCTTTYPVDPTHVDDYLEALRAELDIQRVVWTDANIYRNAYRSDVLEWIGWGSFAQSTRYSRDFIKGTYLLEDDSYEAYAAVNLDTQLGNNPQCLSYITGLGRFYPQDPLQTPSDRDGVAEPVPGLPVNGPAAHIPMSNEYYYQAQCTENLYPAGEQVDDPYPILRRYYDIFELPMMSEFTIMEIAVSVAVFAYFSDVDTGASGVGDPEGTRIAPPQVTLYAATGNPFYPATTLRFDIPAAGSRVELGIFTANGRRVRSLLAKIMPAGRHAILWDGRDDAGRSVSSGTYFGRLSVWSLPGDRQSDVVKMTLIR